MKKRIIGFALSAMLLALSVSAQAQQAKKVPRVGFLSPYGGMEPRAQAFQQGLRDLGYIEGKSVVIEWRFANAKADLLPKFAEELVGLKVDVIVTLTTPAIRAVKKATVTIPIIMLSAADPVEAGLADSLARPGGNVTGLTSMSADLYGKRFELLKEVVPRLSRVGVLHDPNFSTQSPLAYKEVETTAGALKLKLQSLEVREAGDFEGAFRAATKARTQALIHFNHSIVVAQMKRVAELATKSRLPMIYNDSQFMEAGGLMSYGASPTDMLRRAATYVDKILKGTKPSDLPIERPMKFELVINLKTAKDIGLTMPQWTLMKADRVIKGDEKNAAK